MEKGINVSKLRVIIYTNWFSFHLISMNHSSHPICSKASQVCEFKSTSSFRLTSIVSPRFEWWTMDMYSDGQKRWPQVTWDAVLANLVHVFCGQQSTIRVLYKDVSCRLRDFRLLNPSGREFTQPRANLIAHLCMFDRRFQQRLCTCMARVIHSFVSCTNRDRLNDLDCSNILDSVNRLNDGLAAWKYMGDEPSALIAMLQ